MATLPQVHLDAADSFADWCTIDPEALGAVYDAELRGTDAVSWKVLTVIPENVPSSPEGRTTLFRAATREALRVGLLMELALHITRKEMAAVARPVSEANAVIAMLETALRDAGRMQALVQDGGLLGRAALLGLAALDGATALVRRGDIAIGTAFLVARDLVLTSAHVVVNRSVDTFVQELIPDLSFHFPVFNGLVSTQAIVARPKGGKGLIHSSLPWGKPPDKLHGPPDGGSATQLDYALIRLDMQVTHVEPLDILEPPEPRKNDPLVVLGFAGGTAVKWDKGLVHDVSGERVEHKANTLAGMSGSCCINDFGKPIGIHEGSLLNHRLGGNGNFNRAVRLSAIRNAMRSNGADPLLAKPKSPGFAIFDESLVRRTANAGLRVLPAEDHGHWRDLVRQVLEGDPDTAGSLPAFHPWFRRLDFEVWVDNSMGELLPEAQRLLMASGDQGAGKSFLASILREKLLDALSESVFISATQTTAWSWTAALGKLGILPGDERELRPHDAEVRRVITEAANEVADKAPSRGSSRAPLFVTIDFEGEASFSAEESPWLRFMQELLGHAWIRLVILGAPAGIRAELIESQTVAGVDRYASAKLLVDPVTRVEFKRWVEKLLTQHQRVVPAGDTPPADPAKDLPSLTKLALQSLDAVLLQFPRPELQSACTALVGIMIQRTMGEKSGDSI